MDMTSHITQHVLQFDGVLHWCILVALVIFVIGVLWVIFRVLLPLRRLARQAVDLMDGHVPDFAAPVKGMREIEQLRQSLRSMTEQVKTAQEREMMYRGALTESQENERKRIAREIHDDTIQSLIVVAHNIERAANAAKTDQSHTSGHLDTARGQVIQIIDDLRGMIADLRPTMLDELGLAVALESLCDQHPALEFAVRGEVYSLNRDSELALFRAAQEAITNAERHAHAQHISATLTYAAAEVRLEVADDGTGFAIPRQLQEFAARGHYGLLGIRERMLHLGGTLALISNAAIGTRVTMIVPAFGG